ncbi:aminoglycoside 6'-N-acetyltransferase I [Orenia metallireducens]|uniref:Aminoglycoside 6'-N-acetyltransferase I n=1 Tax=Orenia metallireducens TaxID=1413210 RepID=A0A285HW52_9FIRM|nr:GNAT family N-acetyltransferase [Orenia metallireducens]PRX29330.1 aminoglycoside 6'-N-acetyltransferase I [Orenia metallireducens]SNY39919.1 aminoglycoside 6'-N-acetyltransferase I [Orenia metallireducens]
MLIDAFGENSNGKWLKDIKESFAEDRISIAAINDSDNAIGWIGGIKKYSGNVWELHPLVVNKYGRKQGIGTLLVTEFEDQVKAKGGITICLGSDDENNSTSLSNVNLYDDLFNKLETIENKNSHPYEFYQNLGYKIVGVLPDANGIGKPDIFLAKGVK